MKPVMDETQAALLRCQCELIKCNWQLIEAQEKLLHPVVGNATEDDYRRLWDVKEAVLRKYNQVIEAFRKVESATYLGPHGPSPIDEAVNFINTVKIILGDDVNVGPKRRSTYLPAGEAPPESLEPRSKQ